jgi:septal ring-binding cell division protein DamX
MNRKYEFSFDNRHVVSGCIAAAVVVGAVFVLGVLVGKKVATEQRATPAQDLLSTLDDKAASSDRPVTPQLTFQEELTKELPEPAVRPVSLPNQQERVSAAGTATADANVQSLAPAQRKPARVSEAVEEKLVSAKRAKAEPKGGGFTLQLTSTQRRADADRFAAGLRQRGYAPMVTEAQVPGRGTWYRVRLGSFSSREVAARFLTDFQRETQLAAYVTAVQ